MSRLLEFVLGSVLITTFTVAFLFFSAIRYILHAGSLADCTWQGSARVWVDSNADGRVDAEELPLDAVRVHVNDMQNPFVDVIWPAITDRDGDVQLSVSIPGCSASAFEIAVDVPDGYRATTRPRIEVHPDLWGVPGESRVYLFGVRPER